MVVGHRRCCTCLQLAHALSSGIYPELALRRAGATRAVSEVLCRQGDLSGCQLLQKRTCLVQRRCDLYALVKGAAVMLPSCVPGVLQAEHTSGVS